MESIELEKQVEQLLETPKFEQLDFEQTFGASLKEVFNREMLVSAAGTAISVNLGAALQGAIPNNLLASLPVGTSSILAGALLNRFGKGNKMVRNLSLGVIQGGLAVAMAPLSQMVGGFMPFNQKAKEETTQELNPLVKGVMW
jgi:hypothetical protein